MSIPFIDLRPRHEAVAADTERRVAAVLESGCFVGGPVLAEVEGLTARLLGREAAAGVGNGTDALILALQAVGVRPGDEVLIPALSFFATAGAVLALKALPVVVDTTPGALMDPEAAQRACTSRTRAVVPVHLFGNVATPPNLDRPIIDDAAQAIGATPAPSIGTLTALSVYPTKTWGAAGDGGFVVGGTEDVERARSLGNHLRNEDGYSTHAGWAGRNSRLDPIQAAVLLAQHATLADRIVARQRLAALYDEALPDHIRPLPRTEGSSVGQYVVRVRNRDQAIARLQEQDIGWALYYPRPLNQEPALAHCPAPDTPVADALADELLALPMRASLSESEVLRVCDALGAS